MVKFGMPGAARSSQGRQMMKMYRNQCFLDHAWGSKWKGVEMSKFGVPGAARSSQGRQMIKMYRNQCFLG